MIIGVGLAQTISLLALPVITRLFEPQAIGLHAIFIAISGSLAVIGTLRLDLALVLPATEWRALRIFAMIVYQAILLGGLLTAATLIFGPSIRKLASPEIATASWLWLLIPFVIASCIQLAGNGLATRHGLFWLTAISNFALSAIFAIGAILIGLFRPTDTGLLWVRVSAQVACSGLLMGLGCFGVVRALRRPSPKLSVKLWSENRQFLAFNTPYSLIGGLARDIPLYVLTVFGGASLGAAYALARTVVMAPTTLLSSALSSVFFRSAVKSFGTSSLERLAERLTLIGLTGSAAGFAYVLFWGDKIFALALGEEWRLAGQFAQALAIPLWFALQNGWPERLFEVARKQHISFTLQIGFDLLHVAVVLVVFLTTKSALVTVFAYALSYTLYQIAYRIAVYRVAGFRLRSLGRSFRIGATVFTGSASSYFLTRLWLGDGLAVCLLCGALAVVVTAVVTVVLVNKNRGASRAEEDDTAARAVASGYANRKK